MKQSETYYPFCLFNMAKNNAIGRDVAVKMWGLKINILSFAFHSFRLATILNGPITASLFSFFSSTNFTEKPVGFSRIQTRIVGVEDEYADHLTTTMAPSSGYFKWRRHCNNAFLSVNSEEIKALLLFELKSKQVSKVFTLKLGHYRITEI